MRVYLMLLSIAACATSQWSTLTLVSSSRLTPTPADTLRAGMRIEIHGVDSNAMRFGQVVLMRTGPDTLPSRYVTKPMGFPFDSLRPGVYLVRVQLIGYTAPRLEVVVKGGELVHLRAEMRRSPVQLEAVTS